MRHPSTPVDAAFCIMRRRVISALAASALLAAALAVLPAAAAGQMPSQTPNPPPYYAITNARIVTVSGPVIENGTVVIANGLITAVGTNVTVPPEAWVIDGEGLTVYPGLFDALSDIGMPQQQAAATGGGRAAAMTAAAAPAADGPEDRPATDSSRAAAAVFSADDSRIESWREGGFTTVMTIPSDGFVTGQGAVVSLGSGLPGELVVRSPAALRLNLQSPRGNRGYPSSLFGVIAYQKQLFIDAAHYARATAADRARPAGLDRPVYDPTLAPLSRAVAERWPVLIPGDDPREILRALTLGSDIGVRTVVYGAQHGYAVADKLAAAGAPVLVNLRWPERTRDADPEAEESLESLRTRAWAPSTPKALYDAGVGFAFYSGGLASPRDVLEHVRTAIDAGLPHDAALRALTLGAAEIYGVADRLGSVERGKIADLIVTDGDIFDEDAKVKVIFVEGQKFEKPEAAKPTEAPTIDLTGTWTLTVESPRGTQESTAELSMAEDGTLSGSVRSARGEGSLSEGWVSGNSFSFTIAMSTGGRSMEAVYSGTLEGEEMQGTISTGRFSQEFTGVKGPGAAVAAAEPAQEEAAPTARERPERARVAADVAPAAGPMAMIDWDAPPPTLVIQNATVMTVTQGTIENASVLVRNGKIAAVGTNVSVPRGATVIDASGKYVTPGIIDAHAHLASDATNEGSIAVSSMVRIEDVINPSDINIYREAAGGVTTSHVLHGSANPIGGQNATIKHRWGEDAEGLIFQAAAPTIKFALGENVKRSNSMVMPGQARRYPASRMGVMDVIREAFLDAQAYKQRWDEYEQARRRDRNAVPPARDLKLEPLVEVLEGRRLVHCHAYRADETLAMLRLAQEFGFKIAIFVHGLESYKLADEIAAAGFGVSTFSDWWAYKMEAWDAIPYNAALLEHRGVLVSINSDSQEEARHLNQEAGKTMKWGGLSEDEALALVTINPAIQLGIADRVGSIEVGKDADLVIWENFPLSAYARTLTTIVDGRIVFDVERDRERQERIAAEKEALQAVVGGR
jgi:imidazolonepropionase-like amidohydrolase